MAVRTRDGDLDGAEAARAELREANAEATIRKLVDQWPPLSATQRSRLALLLAPGDSGT